MTYSRLSEIPISNISKTRWSDALARVLFASMSGAEIKQLSVGCEDTIDLASVGQSDVIERSRTDFDLRAAMMRTWRWSHPEVIEAARFVPVDGTAEQCEALLRQFSLNDVLLELITDEREEGWEMIEWTVDHVKKESVRGELAALLRSWKGEAEDANRPSNTEATIRIVIFGGHPRDERKMNRRLFDNSPFDVRWKPCEKNQGSPSDKDLIVSMAHADAVILVTSMVSHNIMEIVKHFTDENDLPLRMVQKATNLQLRGVLAELFPDIALPGG